MVDVLAYPFRVTRRGTVATTPEGTDRSRAEAIAVLMLTRRGERPLVPAFGVPDPTFTRQGPDLAELLTAVRLFGPAELRILDVRTRPTTGTKAETVIEYR